MQVGQYQIVIGVAKEIDGFVAARSSVDDVAFPFENRCGRDAQALFVVDDEQACFFEKGCDGAGIVQWRIVPRLVKLLTHFVANFDSLSWSSRMGDST